MSEYKNIISEKVKIYCEIYSILYQLRKKYFTESVDKDILNKLFWEFDKEIEKIASNNNLIDHQPNNRFFWIFNEKTYSETKKYSFMKGLADLLSKSPCFEGIINEIRDLNKIL